MPKYVASRSLPQTAWNATLPGPDPSSAIAGPKDQPGMDLIKYGTSRLDDTLVRDHLIDESRFWIMPVVAGTGRRLFEHVDTSGLGFRLTDVTRLENGVGDPHLRARLTQPDRLRGTYGREHHVWRRHR